MRAEIYSKENCIFCVKAKDLLTKRGIAFDEISAVEFRDVLIERVTRASGAAPKTVPQIFIDSEYVGGYDQLVQWSFKAATA